MNILLSLVLISRLRNLSILFRTFIEYNQFLAVYLIIFGHFPHTIRCQLLLLSDITLWGVLKWMLEKCMTVGRIISSAYHHLQLSFLLLVLNTYIKFFIFIFHLSQKMMRVLSRLNHQLLNDLRMLKFILFATIITPRSLLIKRILIRNGITLRKAAVFSAYLKLSNFGWNIGFLIGPAINATIVA
jgi:hypothetical protein